MTNIPEPTRSNYAQLATMVDACEPREMESHVWRVVRDQRDKICDLEWDLERAKQSRAFWFFGCVTFAALWVMAVISCLK